MRQRGIRRWRRGFCLSIILRRVVVGDVERGGRRYGYGEGDVEGTSIYGDGIMSNGVEYNGLAFQDGL